MRILLMLLSMTLSFCFGNIAKASEGCPNAIRLSIAKDTEGITWKSHGYDVKKYAEEHRFGTRDDARLHISVGDGDWCVNFGSLRDFKYAMGGITHVVVTVGYKQVVSSTDINSFQVLGLNEGDLIEIEIVQLAPFRTRHCHRKISNTGWTQPYIGEARPRANYMCRGSRTTQWSVVEERVYAVDSDLGKRR
ncbi:hypothetical protein HOI18_02575 [Candidatus Uhrbacteria bacterium]|jgi:hypothetical protein|nr:hypothetical protein [Candidatus Uhrbacteria bacterium]